MNIFAIFRSMRVDLMKMQAEAEWIRHKSENEYDIRRLEQFITDLKKCQNDLARLSGE